MTPPLATRVRRAFALAAMVLVLLYVTIDVVLQVLPPHYSLLSDAESDLAVGPFGWAMNLNFLARAVMSGCLVMAVSVTAPASRVRRAGSALLAVAGLCSAALVFFPTDVNRPGEFGMTPRTSIGFVHVLFATSGFLAVLAAMALLTWWIGRPRAVRLFFGVALVGLVLLGMSLVVLPHVVGLTERICLLGILGWAFVFSVRLIR
ncbi:DUF998 domain-containing protein [Glaciihabitans sp. INWT7]|uniref:DUF998 domain-containing protein n=1 Tax=Glaciihabitans sp. INWT7 TaxID=2596912 RepID=UPI0016268BB0|nr:DUF998 domain-containing protein [Glaciihabitans sp. INWT7]